MKTLNRSTRAAVVGAAIAAPSTMALTTTADQDKTGKAARSTQQIANDLSKAMEPGSRNEKTSGAGVAIGEGFMDLASDLTVPAPQRGRVR